MDSGMVKVFIVVFLASFVVRFLLAKYPAQAMGNF
jgi:hypothetical protein